ncbi:antibiotic biosynthesis monooxygenase [Flavobacterium sufflavum]|uniref:Antibiotic biosynthesis monooxygenase n=1 Tax=Flavobacterium sufflavum TaxID=1921138 RepID=A0A3S3ST59_9FLAO|nr:antibiotic biosynthesis monooxygenase [Flavobacterium sufflavum]RVT73909.1 antibiotic biosynthesis monooxygenase [Flavobacterium sufflavum]
MILEIATFDIKEQSQTAFTAAFQEAKLVVSKSKGFLGLECQHCIEIPTKFVILIHWETLEDHTIGFRESDLFVQWRALLSPHFQNPPVAEHFEIITKI